MSMFYELMMRKKEQIMYATIKGTLTENNGVFSGWSLSNYLEIQNLLTFGKNNFELKVCITPTSTNSSRICASGDDSNSFTGIYVRNSNFAGSFYDGATRTIIDTTISYTANTTYYVILYRSGTKIGIKVSTDDVNYTDFSQTISSSTEIVANSKFVFGKNSYNSTYIVGSIDLNNSYIKLGSTKYNLQAVVGYTVVGSPTITDGVVSGFSSSDYLRLKGFTINSDYEIGTKIIVNNLESESRNIIGSQFVFSKFGFMIGTNNKPYSSIRYELNGTYTNITSSINLVLQPNTIYYLKAILKNNTYQAFLSTDKINWIEGNIANVPTGATIVSPNTLQNQVGRLTFGGGTQYTTFDGSIYLNETYIKLDNKLWFNGQQA